VFIVEIVASGELVAELHGRSTDVNKAAGHHQAVDCRQDNRPTVLEMPPVGDTVSLLLLIENRGLFELYVVDAFVLKSVELYAIIQFSSLLVDKFRFACKILNSPNFALDLLLHIGLEDRFTLTERQA